MLKQDDEKIVIRFVGNLTEDCEHIPSDSSYGFAITSGEKSCYIPIGDIERTKIVLEKHDDDFLYLLFDLMQSSDDECVSDIADDIRASEEPIILNGKNVSMWRIEEALGLIGESL
jgi:hypothetical protein